MSNRMPKTDLSKLNSAQLDFVKQIEKENRQRVEKLLKVRRNNLITAGFLGATVLGIYSYSIYAVRQESFLDDFEEPVKTQSQSQ